ncbi:MAG: trimethylamine methyltransferase family protein, partial [Deltaproteobacteria bacterium]|nr:trimethylamine methyltransferase family protein [Deltaproteobacteria bacterium]
GLPEEVRRIIDLVAIVFGGRENLQKKPVLLTLINTLSPLRLDPGASAALRLCAADRQPVIISPGPMAGATGPVTLAGTLALGNAEILGTIVVGQMLQPGLPIVYGFQGSPTNLRTGGNSLGAPGVSILIALNWRGFTACRPAAAGPAPTRCTIRSRADTKA